MNIMIMMEKMEYVFLMTKNKKILVQEEEENVDNIIQKHAMNYLIVFTIQIFVMKLMIFAQ